MTPKLEISLAKLSVMKNFLLIVISISAIHGFNHITKKGYHPLERLLWLVLVSYAAYQTVSISKISLDRYQDNPTVISLERDRYSWNTSFPAATICPLNKVNEELLDEYLDSINSSHITDKVQFRKFVTSLLNATYENFDEILDYGNYTGDELLNIIKKFRYRFTLTVSSTIFTEKYPLQMSLSELGVCYSFNSQMAIYNSFEYWQNGTKKLVFQNATIHVNPMDGEVYASIINMSTGFKIYVHGPYEVADISSKYYKTYEGYFMQIYLSGLTIFTSNRAKTLQPNQRKCRFYYESNLRYSPVYSYVLCRIDCRAKFAEKLCGCVPHFYKKNDVTICSVAGLKCLSRHKDELIKINGQCSCLPNCEETNYSVDDWDSREWFLGTVLQWGLKECPKMRFKRDIIFGFSDLLVYVGGVAGLFLGCSILSFIEIAYFFTLRLYWFLVRKETQT